jgi:hypothetical protein
MLPCCARAGPKSAGLWQGPLDVPLTCQESAAFSGDAARVPGGERGRRGARIRDWRVLEPAVHQPAWPPGSDQRFDRDALARRHEAIVGPIGETRTTHGRSDSSNSSAGPGSLLSPASRRASSCSSARAAVRRTALRLARTRPARGPSPPTRGDRAGARRAVRVPREVGRPRRRLLGAAQRLPPTPTCRLGRVLGLRGLLPLPPRSHPDRAHAWAPTVALRARRAAIAST